jgi:hypothetical protein
VGAAESIPEITGPSHNASRVVWLSSGPVPMKSNVISCLFALAYSSGVLGEGGPPMITDDPGTPGNGNWEINVAWLGEHDAVATTQNAPLLDLNYGLGARIQLKYEVPWLLVHGAGADSASGIGDSLAGVKWRFYDTGDPQRWQVSMYPQYEFNSAGGSDRRGVLERGAHWLLPLEFQRNFGIVDLNFEFGRTLTTQGAAQDDWFGGVVVGRKLTPRFETMLELQGTFARNFNRNSVILNSGVRYKIAGPFTLLAAVGSGIGGNERPAWIGYLGLQFASD